MKPATLFLTLILVFGTAFGMIGGQSVSTQGEFARHLVMVRQLEAGAFCSGVLVTSRIVLTAAHCVTESGRRKVATSKLQIYFGAQPFDDLPIESRDVVSTVVHGRYGIPHVHSNDLALIRMKRPAPAGFHPLSISRVHPFKSVESPTLTILGYGRVESGHEGFLRFTELPSYEADGKLEFVLDQESGSCITSGDSGGPALIRAKNGWTVVGIASQVANPLEMEESESPCAPFAVYMNLFGYRDWLFKSLRRLNSR